MKKIIVIIAIVAVMLIGSTVALAATAAKTPPEIVSDLTGKTVEQVTDARQDGKTYGAQAADAGKLEAFKQERLAQYKLALDAAVKEKRLTQAEADKLYDAMKARMETCTGNGTGMGAGNGCGLGNGARGQGRGMGLGRTGGCGNCTQNS